jgi:GNAT superfamily N-acetyltransferase
MESLLDCAGVVGILSGEGATATDVGGRSAMDLVVRELTKELWPALEELFSTTGPVGRCWCMGWRIGPGYRRRAPDENREEFRRVVAQGPPPGLVALDNGTAVGWCQLTPRSDLPALERNAGLRVDDAPVWALSCFYVRKGHRRRGVTGVLIEAAIEVARQHGAPALEAYPLDANLTPSASGTGYASTFERLGFTTVARHGTSRPIVRYVFTSADGGC